MGKALDFGHVPVDTFQQGRLQISSMLPRMHLGGAGSCLVFCIPPPACIIRTLILNHHTLAKDSANMHSVGNILFFSIKNRFDLLHYLNPVALPCVMHRKNIPIIFDYLAIIMRECWKCNLICLTCNMNL